MIASYISRLAAAVAAIPKYTAIETAAPWRYCAAVELAHAGDIILAPSGCEKESVEVSWDAENPDVLGIIGVRGDGPRYHTIPASAMPDTVRLLAETAEEMAARRAANEPTTQPWWTYAARQVSS